MRTLITLAALPLMACSMSFGDDNDTPGIAGTGTGTIRSYQVADFSRVAARGSDDVDIRVGSTFAVRAEGDPEVLEYLKIEKDGDTLKIGRRNRAGFNWGDREAKIFVTMPALSEVSAAGSGDVDIDRVQGGTFAASGAGSGDIAIAALTVDRANFNLAGSGSITAAGTAKAVSVKIAGSGDVDGKGLKADGADISIAGSGDVQLDVTGDAKVSMMGSGDVDVGPNAKCSVSKMGSRTVTCGK